MDYDNKNNDYTHNNDYNHSNDDTNSNRLLSHTEAAAVVIVAE
jgi:hypothetical protein